MRVIKVKGVGKMAVQPDAVVFTFNLEEINSDYEECINNLNKRTASLRSDIEGVSREQT